MSVKVCISRRNALIGTLDAVTVYAWVVFFFCPSDSLAIVWGEWSCHSRKRDGKWKRQSQREWSDSRGAVENWRTSVQVTSNESAIGRLLRERERERVVSVITTAFSRSLDRKSDASASRQARLLLPLLLLSTAKVISLNKSMECLSIYRLAFSTVQWKHTLYRSLALCPSLMDWAVVM